MHIAAHQRAVDKKAIGGHLEAVIARSDSDEAIHTSFQPRGSMDCFAFARNDDGDIVVIPVAIPGQLIYREHWSAPADLERAIKNGLRLLRCNTPPPRC